MELNACFVGDCRDAMRQWIAEGVRVQCVVTSPPYWGLRDYGHPGQLGLEVIHDCSGWATGHKCGGCYVCNMTEVFQLVYELLEDDGTLWLNLGDTYAGGGRGGNGDGITGRGKNASQVAHGIPQGLKPKDLAGIPWRVALALQAAGWFLRMDHIWSKPNPMPESVEDRCTKSHEYLFLLTKSPRYYYDRDAIAETLADSSVSRLSQPGLHLQKGSDRVPGKTNGPMKAVGSKRYSFARGTKESSGLHGQKPQHREGREDVQYSGRRNKRSVWTVSTKPYRGAHFAVMPTALVEPCILAGTRPGQIVLDPFGGSGTVPGVAQALGRSWLACELNPLYLPLQRDRTRQFGLALEVAA